MSYREYADRMRGTRQRMIVISKEDMIDHPQVSITDGSLSKLVSAPFAAEGGHVVASIIGTNVKENMTFVLVFVQSPALDTVPLKATDLTPYILEADLKTLLEGDKTWADSLLNKDVGSVSPQE